jgi:predicted phosphodiesterase
MKLLIASDIHGAADWCERLMAAVDAEKPERVLLLGDLLYHGPRNDLPPDYAPKRVIEMLNGIKDQVICVRGNCEAEVDQMVLDFPCMADYSVLWDPDCANPATGGRGRELFLTHGHVWGPGIHNSVDKMPQLPAGAAMVYGHTHKKVNQESATHPGIWCFNPGSVGIPKDGTHSYGLYEDGTFRHVELG